MTLQPGTEKTGLIPVLETMLQVKFNSILPRFTLALPLFYPHFQFDPKEKECIMSLAMGEDALETAKAGGWGSYLPRWGGL